MGEVTLHTKLLRVLLLVVLAAAGCGTQGRESAPTAPPGSPTREPPAATAPFEDERPPGSGPRGGTASADRVWVAVEDAHRLALVDVGDRRVVREHRLPGAPHNVTVEGIVAVTLPAEGRLALVDRRSVVEVDLEGSPHDVKGAGDTFVVANEGAGRLDFVSAGGRLLGSVHLEANPHDLAITADGRTAWVSLDDTDELAEVDLRRRAVRRYVRTGARPHDLLVAPDGRLWVTDWGGDLHVFSRRGELLRTLSLGQEIHHLAFPPEPRREGWVTDHVSRAVFIVDAGSLEVLAELPVDGAPHHVAITEDGRWAAVADHHDGSLVVFDVARRKRVAEIPVGPGPHGVWAASGEV